MSQPVTRLMFSCIACVAILSGCSYEGKIVRKEFKPLPFYSALGVRGLYRFEVRCRDGQIRRQVVSANVYADYKPGDYFSDRPEQISSPAPPAEGPHPAVAARFMIMLALRPLQEYGPHFPSVPTAWVEPAASPSNDRVSPNVGSR